MTIEHKVNIKSVATFVIVMTPALVLCLDRHMLGCLSLFFSFSAPPLPLPLYPGKKRTNKHVLAVLSDLYETGVVKACVGTCASANFQCAALGCVPEKIRVNRLVRMWAHIGDLRVS